MNNKKVKEKTIRFKDYPKFRPNLTPRQIFLLGSFGGTYWRPITSKVTKKSYKNKHKEFPKSWWKGIPNKWLTSPVCDLSINNYGVKSGTSLRFWEKKGWMNKQDPYGWVQWYCRFYKGRRTPDDKRQIKRWLAFSGPKGRFKRRLVNMIKKKKTKYNDYKISPVIRQGLQHWAYRLVPSDVRKKPVKKRNFGKWSLKYKRSINCKRPKGFSQKQYCKRKRKFGKKTFLYNPNNPKTSFDVYINKNPKDTIPIKYTTIKDVQNTIRKLERLYKAKKYPHTRIWKVGMILKVRLEAMVKHTGKKKTHFKHSKNYFHFLGQRTTKKEPERRKMIFKFNKTYRKVKKVKRKRKFGSDTLEKYKKRIDNLKLIPVDKKKVEKILRAAEIKDESSSENLNNNFIKKLEGLKKSKQKQQLINNEYLFYSTLVGNKIKGKVNKYRKLFPTENSKYTPEEVEKATEIVKQFNDFVKDLESATCMEDINEIKKNKNYNKIITKKVLKVGSKWQDINDTIKLAEEEYLNSLEKRKLDEVKINIDNTCVNTEASRCITQIYSKIEGPDTKYSLKGLELEKLQKEKEKEKDESKINDLEKKIKEKQEEMKKLLEKQEEARITNECMIFGKKRKRKKVKRKRKKKKKKKVKRKRKRKRKKVKRKRKKVKRKSKRKFGVSLNDQKQTAMDNAENCKSNLVNLLECALTNGNNVYRLQKDTPEKDIVSYYINLLDEQGRAPKMFDVAFKKKNGNLYSTFVGEKKKLTDGIISFVNTNPVMNDLQKKLNNINDKQQPEEAYILCINKTSFKVTRYHKLNVPENQKNCTVNSPVITYDSSSDCIREHILVDAPDNSFFVMMHTHPRYCREVNYDLVALRSFPTIDDIRTHLVLGVLDQQHLYGEECAIIDVILSHRDVFIFSTHREALKEIRELGNCVKKSL